MSRPIFARFPELSSRQPWVSLADLPTPVRSLGTKGNAWLKQDDLSNALYGGNKVRKLEFIIGEWRQQAIREVITFGAIGTNAGLATALACHHEGLACRVLLFDQPVTTTVQANFRAMQQLGGQFEYCGSLPMAWLRFNLHPLRLRRNRYFLFAGCANPPATLAYVNAALELAEQIAANQLPPPAEIVLPVGSSSTLAGLTLGCQIAGLKTQVIGVRVVPETLLGIAACTPATVKKQMRAAATSLGWSQPLPEPILIGEYLGAGYGHATAESTEAVRWFGETHGVMLEGTYTGKAAAYFLARLTQTGDPLLFWNTFNSRPLAGLPTADRQNPVPPALAKRMA